jgi:AraC-like DNA-binding protein
MNVSLLRGQKLVRVQDKQAESVFEFMAGIWGPHRLDIFHTSDLSFSYIGNASPSANLTFGYLEYGTDVGVNNPADFEHYVVNLPLRGRLAVTFDDRKVWSTPQRAILLSPGKQISLDIERDWRSVFITISSRIMELALSQLIGQRVKRPLVFDVEMPMNTGASASWWRTAEHYLKEITTEGSMLLHPHVAKELELSLVRALLITHQSNYSDEIAKNLPEMMPIYLQKAVRFIEENYQEGIHLDSLRKVTEVSADKLCSGFKEFSGVTPMGYLKKIRLMKAREQFMTLELGKTVSTVAFEVGFNHLGRFSVEYRSAFGESPKETISRRFRRVGTERGLEV